MMNERIIEARKSIGLSRLELAKKIGVSRAAIGQWESGDTSNIKKEHLFRLEELTGYSARWISIGKGAKHSSTLSEEEYELVERFRCCNVTERLMLLRALPPAVSRISENSTLINQQLNLGELVVKRIKSLRLSRGWSQGELAKRCGWKNEEGDPAQSRVGNYESGRAPKIDDLDIIAKALGVTVVQLIVPDAEAEENELVKLINGLSEKHKKLAVTLLNSLKDG